MSKSANGDKWRESSRTGGVPVAECKKALAGIRARRGELTARTVVDEATPEDSPIHPCFEWDNTKAADSYRLQQASTLIRAVITYVDNVEAPVYVCVPTVKHEGFSVYRPVVEVVKEPDQYEAALGHLRSQVDQATDAAVALEAMAARVPMAETKKRATRAAREGLEAARSALKEASV